MESQGWFMMFYDKYAGDKLPFNKKTALMNIENVVSSNMKVLCNDEAVNYYNKFFKTDKITEKLDYDFYKISLYERDNNLKKDTNKEIYTVVAINIEKLEKIVSFNNEIPNKNFFSNLCKFDNMYKITNITKGEVDFDIQNKILTEIYEEIISKVMQVDENMIASMIENPDFLNLKLYSYQKRTIKWMLDI